MGTVFLLLASVVTTGAMETSHPSPKNEWQQLRFDGTGFRTGTGAGTMPIMVRDGYYPVPGDTAGNVPEEKLPAGFGAIAGFCYLHSAGGKLRDMSGYAPLARMNVEISGANSHATIVTDDRGYFVLALPPGEYQVKVRSFIRSVVIEKGKTSLVAVRGGKRMGD
jgi:hypothetical protein